MAKAGELGPIIIADIDQVNMFSNAEWDAIRGSIDEDRTEIASWTAWLHQKPPEVVLPSGEVVFQDREGPGREMHLARIRQLPHKLSIGRRGLTHLMEALSRVLAMSGTSTMASSSSNQLCLTPGSVHSMLPSLPMAPHGARSQMAMPKALVASTARKAQSRASLVGAQSMSVRP